MNGLDYQAKELACNQDKRCGNNVTRMDEMPLHDSTEPATWQCCTMTTVWSRSRQIEGKHLTTHLESDHMQIDVTLLQCTRPRFV